jgi:phage terminase small subunit
MIAIEDLGPAVQEALLALPHAQRDFIMQYCHHGNALRAYAHATGEKDPSKAAKAGHEWAHRRPKMAEIMREIRILHNKQFQVTENKILETYAHLAFGDIRSLFNDDGTLIPITEMSAQQANMIQSFEVVEIPVGTGEDRKISTVTKIRLINRRESLDSLAKTQGMFLAERKKDTSSMAKVVKMPGVLPSNNWQNQHGKVGVAK